MQANGELRPNRGCRGAREDAAEARCADAFGTGPTSDLLHEIFEASADERPRAAAVAIGREATAYAGLERYANRLARHLWAAGVRRGARVAMLLPHSLDAYAAMLGILKAGAACVPIDVRDPLEHVFHVLGDSGATVLVTATDQRRRRAAFRGAVVEIDLRRTRIAAEDPTRMHRETVGTDPRDLCFVLYAADPNRRPRGVMVEHRNAAHLVRAGGRLFGIRPWDRVYQGSALSACESLHETWLAFHAGATLVPRLPASSRARRRLAPLLSRARVTVLPCTPRFLSGLTEDVPSLRLVILAAAGCTADLVARWSRADRRIVGTYGHAETAMMATCVDLVPRRPVTAGRPVPGCRVYVLDDGLRLARYGSVGEICVGGVGVARGYLGLPVDTRARFVRDPFVAGDARLYLTGDLGRITPNGELVLHGRATRHTRGEGA